MLLWLRFDSFDATVLWFILWISWKGFFRAVLRREHSFRWSFATVFDSLATSIARETLINSPSKTRGTANGAKETIPIDMIDKLLSIVHLSKSLAQTIDQRFPNRTKVSTHLTHVLRQPGSETRWHGMIRNIVFQRQPQKSHHVQTRVCHVFIA